MRKITLVGTSCVGKTTIVERIAAEDQRVEVSHELAREFFSEYPEILDRSSKDIQGALVDVLIENEKKIHGLDPEIILCDRAALAAVIYTLAAGDHKGADEILSKIEYWLPTYNTFVLLDPSEVPYAVDSVRTEDPEARQAVHETYLDFLEGSDLPFVHLTGTLDERISAVQSIVDNI